MAIDMLNSNFERLLTSELKVSSWPKVAILRVIGCNGSVNVTERMSNRL
jgi:hypothetical protein